MVSDLGSDQRARPFSVLALAMDSSDDSSDEDRKEFLRQELNSSTYAALFEFLHCKDDPTKDAEDGTLSESGGHSLLETYTPQDMTVVASTIARLQKSGLEAKVKSELALKENVNLQLDPSSPGQEVHNLVHSGVIRINKVLSPELCSKCLAFVTQNLDDAILRDAVMTVETGFGNVLCRDKRWDMYQPNDGPIAEALQYMLGSRENPLPRLFDELFESNDSYFHELSALISDLGALSQSIHPDTPYQPVAPLYTVFIALHEVTENMGGTVFLPGTNTEKHHEDHKMRSTKDDYTKGDDYRRSVLGTGDCVIFDSRTLHCGPANTEGRRTMLYFTLRNPLCVDGVAVPKGSLFPDISISIKSFRIEPPPAHDVCTGAT